MLPDRNADGALETRRRRARATSCDVGLADPLDRDAN
jgi:hypothetical protein